MRHPSRWSHFAVVLGLTMLLAFAGALAQMPTTLSFSTPYDISQPPDPSKLEYPKQFDDSAEPQVGSDVAGNVYVVWQDQDDVVGNANILFRRSTDGGATFSDPINISRTPNTPSSRAFSWPYNPRIAVESDGTINVIWLEDSATTAYDVYYARSTDGLNFSEPLNLSNDSADNARPQIAVDSSRRIHVVWENDSAPSGIFYTQSTDEGLSFSLLRNGSTVPWVSLGSSGDAPELGVAGDNVYVAWTESTSLHSHISFSRSNDAGASFSSAQNLTGNTNASSAKLAVDGSGNPYLAWIDKIFNPNTGSSDFDLLFSYSIDLGTTFSSPTDVSNNSPGDAGDVRIATDATGSTVYLVWRENPQGPGTNDIYFAQSTNGGVNFSPAINISQNSGNSIAPWMSVDSSGKINVAWVDTTPGPTQTFFVQSTDGGASFPNAQNLSTCANGVSADPCDAGRAQDGQVLADKDGNVNVVWSAFVTGLNQNVNQMQILFSRHSNVQKTNHPPVANAGQDQTLPSTSPAGAPVTLDGSASSDPDGDALTYEWKDENNTVVGNAAVVSLTVSKGTHAFTLTVTDTGGLSSAPSVTHVTILNQAPLANAGPNQTLHATGTTTPVTLDGSASTDPDDTTLTYVWREGNTVVGNSAVVQVNVSLGLHTFTLTVTDPAGLSDSKDTQVTIGDQAPLANPGANQTLHATGATTPVTLNGSASTDPDDTTLTYVWKEGSTLVGSSAVVQVNVSLGVHTFTLTVTDPAGLSDSKDTQVTINDQAPLANAGPNQTLQGTGAMTPVTLNGSASTDPDDTTLTYVWKEGSTVVGSGAVLQLHLGVGTHTFTLTVTDPAGLSSTAGTQVIIDQAPHANAGPNQTISCAPRGGALVTLDGSQSLDPDGDVLAYLWTDETNHVVGTSKVVQVLVPAGTHTFTLTVTDPANFSGQATTLVTVNVANAPTLSVSLSPNVLWPPNHKMVQINANVSVSDACTTNLAIKLESITRSDGNTNDKVEALDGGPLPFGTDVRAFLVRAENSDTGGDLIYTVVYSVTDSLGNCTKASAQVLVSHNPVSSPAPTLGKPKAGPPH